MKKNQNQIIIYEANRGTARVEVKLSDETVWLTLNQLADLFNTDKSGISRHIKNVFDSGELERATTVAKNATVQKEGSRTVERNVEYFNLDVILSVGYRVNSKKATAFRVWANRILKNYLVKGYAINESKFLEVQKIVQFITQKAKVSELTGHEKEILDVIERYSKTWKVLSEYDEGDIKIKKEKKAKFQLNYYKCRDIVERLKAELTEQKIAGDLFGIERDHSFEAILGSLYQTYASEELYISVEEKAAHLLYFVIKDHPFSDGNKRIGSLLFLHFLDQNNFLFKSNGETKISDRALVALALLVACSEPREKETMTRLIVSLIQE